MKGTPGENALKWLFCGKMRNYIRCCNVDYKSERIEDFYDLSLNVKGIPTILGSFKQYVEAEKMEGDNKYKPNDELGYQDADRGTEFAEFPAVLHLHLKRFEYDWERDCMAKINDRYEFTETLDLTEICPRKDSGAAAGPPNVYKLHSVMVHSGDVFGGHYYAYIRPKCAGDEWFKFDDDRVSAATPEQAIDGNFGVTPSQATVGFKRCSNAYMLVYVRAGDVPTVCKDVPLESVPLALRERFDAEEAVDRKKQELKLQQKFNVLVNYCTVDDLKGIPGKGLLPSDHTFRTLFIRKSLAVSALRAEFASGMKCSPSDVLLLNYKSYSQSRGTGCQQFTKSYESDQEPVFRLLEKEKGNGWDPMVCFVCRKCDVANAQNGIKNVVVVKSYDVATKSSKFLGLLNLETMTHNEISSNVRALLDAAEGGPYLPNLRLFLEPTYIKDDPEEITRDYHYPIPAGSCIVVEVLKQQTAEYVAGEFMNFYRDVDNMVTIELRHAASPPEEVRPTFKHRCLRSALYQDVVATIAQHYGLDAPRIRLLQHDTAFNVPKRMIGVFGPNRPIEQMFDYVRKLYKEHTLHFEVLDFDVAELLTKKLMKVFICTPDVNVHVKELLPLEWTASEICQFYQEKYPLLAGANLRILIVGSNRLLEQLCGSKCVQEVTLTDDIRIEVVPPSHINLPQGSMLVPVQLCVPTSFWQSFIVTI